MNSRSSRPSFLPFKRLFLCGIALSVTASCSVRPHKAYFDGRNTPPAKDNAWVTTRRFDTGEPRNQRRNRLIVTEFREKDGKPWIPAQTQDALKQIKEFQPKTVLVYVHGWHNDSSPDCGEEQGKDLNDLDSLIHRMPEDKMGRVLAIYVGWRGESLNGLLKWTTLTPRRRVARRLGESPYLREFLGDVAEAGKSRGANVVFAGHSLGAVLLEKTATEMIEKATPGHEQRLPHLFLLANSAELAAVSKDYIARVNNSLIVTHQPENTRLVAPRILAITSSKDLANLLLQPLNNILLHPLATLYYARNDIILNSVGFDRSTRTHNVINTGEMRPEGPLPAADLRALQLKLSMEPTLDPAFWVPNKESRLTKYRIVPKPEDTRTTGYWNLKAPGFISRNHNDVYDEKFLAAGVSWFRMLNHSYPDLPDTLPEMLAGLKAELRNYPLSNPDNVTGRRGIRAQWVMGAAMRMPYNKTTFGLLLGELENSDAEVINELDTRLTGPKDYPAIVRSHRVHLFAILKYTHSAHAVWDANPALLSRLRALMENKDLRDALARAGAAESGKDRETDENLKAFYKFLRKHDIRTP